MDHPEATLLELDGQLTDWLELSKEEGDGLPRVRLTYVPSGLWSQIVARQDSLLGAVAKLNDNLHASADIDGDLEKIGKLSERAQLLSLQLIGLSLREVDGFAALKIGEEGGVDPEQLEAMLAMGWTDPLLDLVIRVHRLNPETWRSLLRGRLGEPVGSVPVRRVPAASAQV